MGCRSDDGVKVFLSYAREDARYQKEVYDHLGALRGERIIEVWWDGKILPGSEWNEEIARRLDQADLIVLLVSSAFLASTYCYDKEMRRAVDRHEAGTARVVWIYLRSCDWGPAPFAKLQGLPEGMKAVASQANRNKRDAVWSEIAQGIHQVVKAWAAGPAIAAPSLNTSGRQSKEPTQSDIGDVFAERIQLLQTSSRIKESIRAVATHLGYPLWMSVSGAVTKNPVWEGVPADEVRRTAEDYHPAGQTPPQIMHLDLLLLRRNDERGHGNCIPIIAQIGALTF
jgi:hypothetical protein